MKSAQPLDGHRLPAAQPLPGRLQGRHAEQALYGPVGLDLRSARRAPDDGATVGTGNRLGVETPVGRIGILGGTGGAHAEPAHGGGGAIVGKIEDDRPTRAAVGAGGKGMAVTPVARRRDVGQAGWAEGDIGRNRGGARPCLTTFQNRKAEARWLNDRQVLHLHALDHRQRRRRC